MYKIFRISELVKRLENMSKHERYDNVIRTIHEIYENRMLKNPTAFVNSDELKQTFSSLSNLNNKSEFRAYFTDIFPTNVQPEPKVDDAFRHAGYEENFRPSPIEVTKTDEQVIREASLNAIQKIASSKILSNPQYHFHEFVRVASEGKNSGIALCTIGFNTPKGETNIQVPVVVVEGNVQNPTSFYVKGSYKPFAFTREFLKTYSSTYSPAFREVSTELSGAETIGTYSMITDHQDIKEASVMEGDAIENSNISVGYSIPIDECLTAQMGEAQQGIMEAIDKARKTAENKMNRGMNGEIMNLDLQISYSGYMNSEGETTTEIPEERPVDGIIAFNASQKTKNGLKTITIPVDVNGNIFAASTFHTRTGGRHELNANAIVEYFADEKEPANEDTPESDTFSEAFLVSGSTLNEIRREMKASIDSDNLGRAAVCLKVIAKKFGNEAFKTASYEFIQFVQEATDSKNNINKCSSCAFFSAPGSKGSTHNIPFCQKLSSDITKVKLGDMTPSDCIKRESSFHWTQENDPEYANYVSTQDVLTNGE